MLVWKVDRILKCPPSILLGKFTEKKQKGIFGIKVGIFLFYLVIIKVGIFDKVSETNHMAFNLLYPK